MEKLHELKENLWAELNELAEKREMGAGDLEVIHKLTDTIKNIGKIEMLDEGGAYSETGAYDGGSSYANRGKHYVRGHYSRDGGVGRRGSRGHYIRDDGYSRDDGRSEMMEHLEMALDSASDEDRKTIKRFMRQLEKA